MDEPGGPGSCGRRDVLGGGRDQVVGVGRSIRTGGMNNDLGTKRFYRLGKALSSRRSMRTPFGCFRRSLVKNV